GESPGGAPSEAKDAHAPRISFSPNHQVLHGGSPLRIEIEDPSGNMSDYRLAIHYNGLDVTRAFLIRADVAAFPSIHKIGIDNPLVRLAPDEDHLIEVFYVGSSGAMSYASYDGPKCSAFRQSPVQNVADFSPSPELVKSISEKAIKSGLSPSFFTALV